MIRKTKLEEERVYPAYISTSQFIIEGGQDRNQEAGADAEAKLHPGVLPMLISACFLIEHKTSSPGTALPANELCPPLSIN